jgi:hypothetical protein
MSLLFLVAMPIRQFERSALFFRGYRGRGMCDFPAIQPEFAGKSWRVVSLAANATRRTTERLTFLVFRKLC